MSGGQDLSAARGEGELLQVTLGFDFVLDLLGRWIPDESSIISINRLTREFPHMHGAADVCRGNPRLIS